MVFYYVSGVVTETWNITSGLIVLVLHVIEASIISIHSIIRGREIVEENRYRRGVSHKRIGRTFEFVFFLSLFVATVLMSFALQHYRIEDLSDFVYFSLFSNLSVFFYICAVVFGVGYYCLKIYD